MYHLTEKPVDMQEHNLLIIVDKSGARQLQSVSCSVMFWGGHLTYRNIKMETADVDSIYCTVHAACVYVCVF